MNFAGLFCNIAGWFVALATGFLAGFMIELLIDRQKDRFIFRCFFSLLAILTIMIFLDILVGPRVIDLLYVAIGLFTGAGFFLTLFLIYHFKKYCRKVSCKDVGKRGEEEWR